MRLVCFWMPAAFLASCILQAAASPSADIVITNAQVITVAKERTMADSVVVSGRTLQYVGTQTAGAKWIGPNTRVINAQGNTVMPGIYDSHVHSFRASVSELGGGAPLLQSIAEAQEWIRQQVSRKPPGSWIVLERVYASRLKEQRLPTKAELDLAAPNNPVHWNSGPVSIANTKALAVSGITRETPNPTPGEVVKNPQTGEPTGMLRNAAHLLKAAGSAYRPTPEEHRAALKTLHAAYNRRGITSIGERRTDPEAIDLFRDMAQKGELSVRVNCTRLLEPVPKTVPEALRKLNELTNSTAGKVSYGPTGVGDDWVRIGPLKVFLDGGMLIGTAYMREPWGVTEIFQITDPKYRGLLNVSPELLDDLYTAAARQGWQLAAHCTGEASPEVLLDVYEDVAKQIGSSAVRNRRMIITHGNFLSEESVERMKRLRVSADVQPAWLYKDGATLRTVLGETRMHPFQPLRTLFDQDVVIGGGSDHMVQLNPVESTNPWDPWLGIWIAITRQTERGSVLNPAERLSREQAIRLYTLNNAYLHREEQWKGSLEVGKLADLIVLDRNLLTCDEDKIRTTQVLLTVIDGRIVWQAKK